MIFAVAETLDEAKQQVGKGCMYAWGNRSDVSADLIARVVKTLGNPTRIVDVPCAEWHWYEP